MCVCVRAHAYGTINEITLIDELTKHRLIVDLLPWSEGCITIKFCVFTCACTKKKIRAIKVINI